MAALLIGMTVAAVFMTAAMPVWKQTTRRERESELVFRGQQYARAIGLFQKRSGPGVLPPSLDVLVSGRFLRKKYKDPITNDDFDLLSPTQAAGGALNGAAGGNPAQGQVPGGGGRGAAQQTGTGAVIANQPGGRGAVGGIVGVASKSKDSSLRAYNGRTVYNEWQFLFVPQVQAPNAPGGAPGQGGNGQPQRGGQPQGGFPGGIGGVGGQGNGGRGDGGRGQGRGQQPPGAGQGGRGLQTPSPFPSTGPAGSPIGPRPPG